MTEQRQLQIDSGGVCLGKADDLLKPAPCNVVYTRQEI